jgi:hypothetical protein
VLIVDDVLAELAPTLREIVLGAAARRVPSAGSANVGGWKSGVDLFTWKHDAIRELAADLKARARLAVGAPVMFLRSWAMVNRSGSRHEWHRHGMVLSGVYYVTCGDPPVATQFQTTKGEIVDVAPRVGRLALFGDLLHRVPVYEGTEPRITIAFDVAQIC